MKLLHGLLLAVFSPVVLFSFEEAQLNLILKAWENKNTNKAIVLITSPSLGKVEFAYTKEQHLIKKFQRVQY